MESGVVCLSEAVFFTTFYFNCSCYMCWFSLYLQIRLMWNGLLFCFLTRGVIHIQIETLYCSKPTFSPCSNGRRGRDRRGPNRIILFLLHLETFQMAFQEDTWTCLAWENPGLVCFKNIKCAGISSVVSLGCRLICYYIVLQGNKKIVYDSF